MRESFFINNAQIKEPLNIRGFYLLRETSKRFNGCIYSELGRTEGISGIITNDPDAIHLIQGLEDNYLTEARAEFRCERFGNLLFSSGIDFSSISKSREGTLDFSLVDQSVNVFVKNIDKKYSISLNTEGVYSSETVYTDYSLQLDDSKLIIPLNGVIQGQQINPIFKNDGKATLLGSILDSTDYNARPFYKNTTGHEIKLNMNLEMVAKVTVSAGGEIEPKIRVRDSNGNTIFDLSITKIAIAGTKDISTVQMLSLAIPSDANVSFIFQSNNAFSALTIEMNEASFIDLSEGDLSAIQIPVISVIDTLKALCVLASDNTLTCEISGVLQNLDLSSYASVRGRESFLNVSFGELWDDLNALYCLRMSKSGTKLLIESFQNHFDSLNPYTITDIKSYTITTDFQNLYNSIECGFENWQPKNDAGVPERTAPVSFSTKLLSASSPLDLKVKKLIGSLKMLSECYLMRNRPGSQNENDDKDQSIFLISSGDPVTSLTSLESWSRVIGSYHKYAVKSQGEGLYMNTDVNFDLTQETAIFTPKRIVLTCNMDTEDFISTGDIVRMQDIDKIYSIFVETNQNYPTSMGVEKAGNTVITGRIINQ